MVQRYTTKEKPRVFEPSTHSTVGVLPALDRRTAAVASFDPTMIAPGLPMNSVYMLLVGHSPALFINSMNKAKLATMQRKLR